MIERWRRLHVEGAARVQAEGGALLLANHAGLAPLDALMIARALPRRAHFLAADWAFAAPWVSIAVRRAGGVPAVAANAERLLREGELVIATVDAPHGEDRRRYRVGRPDGSLVELAARTGAPVVPVAVIGAEDAPVAHVPVPSRWRIELGQPLRPVGSPLELSETIRDRIQTMVYDNLVRREGAFI